MAMKDIVPTARITAMIYELRGVSVMLDKDIAVLYDVTTGNLNRAVTRNLDLFPADFMFRLTREEAKSLLFQNGRAKPGGRGGTRIPPRAFTEQGVAMLSGVLKSKRSRQVNIQIMRAFVQMRRLLASHVELARKIDTLERKVTRHDKDLKAVFTAIKQLTYAEVPPKRRIGF